MMSKAEITSTGSCVFYVDCGERKFAMKSTTNYISCEDVCKFLLLETSCKRDQYYLLYDGKIVNDNDFVFTDCDGKSVKVNYRMLGGKGGFGSMLRAIGAQIEKTTNREACRDLSGRRLRDINEEKRLKKWIDDQANREREAAEKKKKKLEKLASEPKHEFNDEQYNKDRSELVDKVHSAVEEGMKAALSTADNEPSTSSGVKRKIEPKNKKKGMLWIDGEDLGSDLSDSDEEDVKKLKSI